VLSFYYFFRTDEMERGKGRVENKKTGGEERETGRSAPGGV
jgi:hypothetical protein